jgi:regulator of protease activity HflC (stomatin/prohibitin superfamily)
LLAAYYKVVDAIKSVVAIENVHDAIGQIAQATLRKVVGQHTLDQMLAETDTINLDIRKILDATTTEWGVAVTLVELKDIQLPDSMQRAMTRQAEAERSQAQTAHACRTDERPNSSAARNRQLENTNYPLSPANITGLFARSQGQFVRW